MLLSPQRAIHADFVLLETQIEWMSSWMKTWNQTMFFLLSVLLILKTIRLRVNLLASLPAFTAKTILSFSAQKVSTWSCSCCWFWLWRHWCQASPRAEFSANVSWKLYLRSPYHCMDNTRRNTWQQVSDLVMHSVVYSD